MALGDWETFTVTGRGQGSGKERERRAGARQHPRGSKGCGLYPKSTAGSRATCQGA